MNEKSLVRIVGSIHFETELLEALDWDEDKLKDVTKKLSEYFAVCSKTDLDLIKVDLGFIFSEEIGNIVSKYVKHVKTEIQEGESDEV